MRGNASVCHNTCLRTVRLWIGIRTSVVLPADIYCFAIGHFDPGKIALAVIAGYNSRVIRNDFDDCSMRS